MIHFFCSSFVISKNASAIDLALVQYFVMSVDDLQSHNMYSEMYRQICLNGHSTNARPLKLTTIKQVLHKSWFVQSQMIALFRT